MSDSEEELPSVLSSLQVAPTPVEPRFSVENMVAESLRKAEQREKMNEIHRLLDDQVAAGGILAAVQLESSADADVLQQEDRNVLNKYATPIRDFPDEIPGEVVLRRARISRPPDTTVYVDDEDDPLSAAVLSISTNATRLSALLHNPLTHAFLSTSCRSRRLLRSIFFTLYNTSRTEEAWQCSRLLCAFVHLHCLERASHQPDCGMALTAADVLAALDALGFPGDAVCVDRLQPAAHDAASLPAGPALFPLQQLLLFLQDYALLASAISSEFVVTVTFALARLALDPRITPLSNDLATCAARLLAAPSESQWPAVAQSLLAVLPLTSRHARNLAHVADVLAASARGRTLQSALSLALLLSTTRGPLPSPGQTGAQIISAWLRRRRVWRGTDYAQLFGQLQLLDLALPFDLETTTADLSSLKSAIDAFNFTIRESPEKRDRCKCKLLVQQLLCKLEFMSTTKAGPSSLITSFFSPMGGGKKVI